jgi:uncharacterized membrane protein
MWRSTSVVLLTALSLGCGEKPDPAQNPACDPLRAVSYTDDLAPVFARYCTACHSTTATDRNGAPAGVDFDTWAAAALWAETANQRVQAGSMPPGGNPVPSATARCLLQAWVDQGAPE